VEEHRLGRFISFVDQHQRPQVISDVRQIQPNPPSGSEGQRMVLSVYHDRYNVHSKVSEAI
jgi:hypothetical protein